MSIMYQRTLYKINMILDSGMRKAIDVMRTIVLILIILIGIGLGLLLIAIDNIFAEDNETDTPERQDRIEYIVSAKTDRVSNTQTLDTIRSHTNRHQGTHIYLNRDVLRNVMEMVVVECCVYSDSKKFSPIDGAFGGFEMVFESINLASWRRHRC